MSAAAYGVPIVWDPAQTSPSQAALDAAFGPLWCWPPSVIARCRDKGVLLAVRPHLAYTGSSPNNMPPYDTTFTMSGAGRAQVLQRTACFRADQWTNTTASYATTFLGSVAAHEVVHILEANTGALGYFVEHTTGSLYGDAGFARLSSNLRDHPFLQTILSGLADVAEYVIEYIVAFFQYVAAPTLRFPEGYALFGRQRADARWAAINNLNGSGPARAAAGEALLRDYFALGSATWAPTTEQATTLASYYS